MLFLKTNLVDNVYLPPPSYFEYGTGENRAKMAMKLNKSLFLLVKSPLYWNNPLKVDFEA